MARFDLSKYATVAERLVQWQESWPDGRIETEIVSLTDSNPRTVVVKASVFYTAGDQANRLPASLPMGKRAALAGRSRSVDLQPTKTLRLLLVGRRWRRLRESPTETSSVRQVELQMSSLYGCSTHKLRQPEFRQGSWRR